MSVALSRGGTGRCGYYPWEDSLRDFPSIEDRRAELVDL
jgi:hypothetical protein